MTVTTRPPTPPARAEDAERLAELGYRQELSRRLAFFDNAAMGFAAISPVVGLYAVIFVGTVVAGPAWIWVLPIALAGQCLLLAVYSELASEFPIAGGAYQWNRRLIGGAYGWFSGWVAVCAYAVANTTIAYLGAPWLLTLLGETPSANRIVAAGMVLVAVSAAAGAFGIGLLNWTIRIGIAAEVVASIVVGVILLLAFRTQDLSILGDTLGAEALLGGSVGASLLAALAVGGWVFIGFDACVSVSEETRDAARHVTRAIWVALLSVAALVMLNEVATTLAHPNPRRGRRRPRRRSRTHGDRVLLRLVVGQAVRRPRARRVRVVRDRGAVAHRAGDVLDRARRRPSRVAPPAPRRPPPGPDRRVNIAAVVWLTFETINIAWPRESIAPPDAPTYQVWAAPMLLAAITVVGLAYLVIARPHRRVPLRGVKFRVRVQGTSSMSQIRRSSIFTA